jgi:hypothetical protein
VTRAPGTAVRHAWRGALVAALLNGLAMPMDILVGRGIPGMPVWPPLASALVGLSLAALLLGRRHRPTMALSSWAFVINNVAILATLWVTSAAYAAAGNWVPFQAHKLGILAVALLAPTLPIGIGGVVAYVGTAITQYQLFAPAVRASLPPGQSWVLLIYGLFGGVLLLNRVRELALERAVERARTEAAATERLARAFLAVRDLANTPLQTLTLAAAALRSRAPQLEGLLDRMDRAIERLRRLNAILEPQRSPRWDQGDESFDPAALLGASREARYSPPSRPARAPSARSPGGPAPAPGSGDRPSR